MASNPGIDSKAVGSVPAELSVLDWDDRPRAHAAAASIFEMHSVDSLLTSLKRDPAGTVDVARSVEKTTHYKWFLAADPNRAFELWLHEYKPKKLRRTGHATVPHNHRFWLTSLILRGGFSDTRYMRAATARPGGQLIEPVATRSMRRGETMVIDADEIHSLSDLREGTVSLVVQSRPVRHYSEVFEDGEVRRYSDLEAKLREFGDSL